jgi:thiosulfate dehydrogenase [quinone] large subunit
MNTIAQPNDLSLAHGLLRVGLGLNILMHGISRLPNLAGFVAHLEQTMARTWLPLPLVSATGYAIPLLETLLGGLLLLGFFLRPALVAGLLLMFVLTFGACLAQSWSVASEQLVYVLVYALLVGGLCYDCWSLDHLLRRPAGASRD